MKMLLDIETAPLDNAADYLEPVTPDARLKDPEKVKADIEAKEAARREKLGLDWNVGRIVAIGYWRDDRLGPSVVVSRNEQEEADDLADFWDEAAKCDQFIGFYVRQFDLPFLIQRSRLLGVPHRKVNLARYRREPVCDLFDELTFDSIRQDGCMKQTLKAFCRRFGVTVPDDDGDGSKVAEWASAGCWDQIAFHLRRDLERTKALAERLGYLTPQPQEAQGVF